MVQGCGSDVGKSVIVAGLCRLFSDRGLVVRPFKSQNMSNNAAVTEDGGEIGRAQALQALACRTKPTVHMNPVLLKPESDRVAQVVVRGRRVGSLGAASYDGEKRSLLSVALESFQLLAAESDLVLVEGAGSPAETNLRKNDIANMGFAAAAGIPVVLLGDIDRGHVIAALVGAHAVLEVSDRARITGFIVNKFRGDPRLFDEGRRDVVRRTGWKDLGLVPWLKAASRLPSEDTVSLSPQDDRGAARVTIVVPLLPRIANFDEFDPLRQEPELNLVFIPPGRPLPGDADLVILPGTKSTLGDLAFFRAQGWDIDLAAHVRRGGHVLGICGGYQLMGRRIADPEGIEGPAGGAEGLGLLDVETVLTGEKILQPARGRLGSGGAFEGYEMHLGRTRGPAAAAPLLTFENGRRDGAISADGRLAGTYVHGLFAHAEARRDLLARFGVRGGSFDHGTLVESALDEIAAALNESLDIDSLLAIAEGYGK
jgi:adenosylcobyric acid synthase